MERAASFTAIGVGGNDRFNADAFMLPGSTESIGSSGDDSTMRTSGKKDRGSFTIRRGTISTSAVNIFPVVIATSSKDVSIHTANVIPLTKAWVRPSRCWVGWVGRIGNPSLSFSLSQHVLLFFHATDCQSVIRPSPASEEADGRPRCELFRLRLVAHAFRTLGIAEIESGGRRIAWAEALADELIRRQRDDGTWSNRFTQREEANRRRYAVILRSGELLRMGF